MIQTKYLNNEKNSLSLYRKTFYFRKCSKNYSLSWFLPAIFPMQTSKKDHSKIIFNERIIRIVVKYLFVERKD